MVISEESLLEKSLSLLEFLGINFLVNQIDCKEMFFIFAENQNEKFDIDQKILLHKKEFTRDSFESQQYKEKVFSMLWKEIDISVNQLPLPQSKKCAKEVILRACILISESSYVWEISDAILEADELGVDHGIIYEQTRKLVEKYKILN